MRETPNMVLIMVDDSGYSDLGCYGGDIETPHLDRLAADGLRSQFWAFTVTLSVVGPAVDVEIGPFDAADLVQPHGRGHRELHDPRHRQGQAFGVIEAAKEAVQLVRGRATIPLCALADESKPLECDARQINGFRRNV